MKTNRLGYGLLAIATVALAHNANASLVAGFFQFDGNKALANPAPPPMSNIMADIWAPGVTAWMVSPQQATQSSGGCIDGTYGDVLPTNASFPGAQGGPQTSANDGSAIVRTTAQFDSKLGFYFRNDSQTAILLGSFCFDVADVATGTLPHPMFSVNMLIGTLNPANTYTVPISNPGYMSSVFTSIDLQTGLYLGQVVNTQTNNFADYSESLGELTLEPGKTIMFEFAAVREPGVASVDSIWVDNVALTAIPEPASVLGLGAVLASGLLLRTRRKI